MANTATRDAALQLARKAKIAAQVSKFFRRYKTQPTPEKIIADAQRFRARGSLDSFAFERVLNQAKQLQAAKTPARPAARPSNGSSYFASPGTAAAQSPNSIDPIWFALAALLAWAALRGH